MPRREKPEPGSGLLEESLRPRLDVHQESEFVWVDKKSEPGSSFFWPVGLRRPRLPESLLGAVTATTSHRVGWQQCKGVQKLLQWSSFDSSMGIPAKARQAEELRPF